MTVSTPRSMRNNAGVTKLADQVRAGNVRAVSRLITLLESHDQDVFGFTQLEQSDTEQRQAGQIERRQRFLRGQGVKNCFTFRARHVIQDSDLDFDLQLRLDELDRLVVADGECRSQGLVPFDDLIEAVFQGRDVEPAAKTKSVGQVVGRIPRRHLIDQPHLPLDERERGKVVMRTFGYFRLLD